LYGKQNIISIEIQLFSNSNKKVDTCMNYTRPQLAITIEPIKGAFSDAKKRGIKLRYLTEVTKDNIAYCKELMAIVDELRHLQGIKGNFMISETEYVAPIILFEKGKVASQIVYSNLKEIVEQQQYFFDTLWNKAIPAKDTIYELEHGIEPRFIETIRDPIEVQMIAFSHVQSATEEILIIFSTANAFYRQIVVAGGMQLCKEAASERNVKIRILTPKDDRIDKVVQELLQEEQQQRQEEEQQQKQQGQQQQQQQKRSRIDIRYIEPALQTKTTVLVIDREFSLSVELKDDTKDTSYEAIGLATYSNSTPTVLSYASIFESLWTQTELYEQVKEAHEQLKMHDKMQREFIDIAAHELRTPIQPILGLSQVLRSKKIKDIDDIEHQELLGTIVRNAKRLQKLTENILDVSKIETQSLQLKKELLNVNEVILAVLADYDSSSRDYDIKKLYNSNVKMTLSSKDDLFVMADRSRLYQVFANLLNNAIKFTREGNITIIIQRNEHDLNEAVVSIRDTGTGIDPDILPRLFSRFATKAETSGTGLGLFISKGIVEAHGGRIWAENNTNERGATFYFTLPLSK
jgi:signal transduction histidine kinase